MNDFIKNSVAIQKIGPALYSKMFRQKLWPVPSVVHYEVLNVINKNTKISKSITRRYQNELLDTLLKWKLCIC